jgi:ectoine hydroxylase-related dioxygenase (phytanoyl-CoA dioxygenase family)
VREQLERNGYVVVEDALAPAEVDDLTAAVDSVYAAAGTQGPLHELAFAGRDERFLDLVAHPATLPLVVETLGWNIYMYHCHLDVHPPAPDEAPRWRWHQDGGRQNVDLASPRPRLSLKIAYFLTAVPTADAGALWVLPRSHTRDSLERPADGSTRPAGSTPLLVRPGTAVIMDRRLWHARGENRSALTRKALFYAYTYRWIRPRDDLELPASRAARLDPLRRQLLGHGTSALGHWIPTPEDVPLRGHDVR